MTLRDVDFLYKEDSKRFWQYYYFVVEKIKAEKKAIDRAKDKAAGSSESDTLRFKDRPKDFYSEIGEME